MHGDEEYERVHLDYKTHQIAVSTETHKRHKCTPLAESGIFEYYIKDTVFIINTKR
jgi:hypothetical protein